MHGRYRNGTMSMSLLPFSPALETLEPHDRVLRVVFMHYSAAGILIQTHYSELALPALPADR